MSASSEVPVENRLKTHCPAGHEYSDENTMRDRLGRRNCRECHRVGVLAAYHKNKTPQSVAKQRARAKAHAAHQKLHDPVAYYARMERKTQVRLARKRGATAAEYIDRKIVFARDEGICGICEAPADPADFHVDHIVPLSRGGEHTYRNVQVAHPICNLRKGGRP